MTDGRESERPGVTKKAVLNENGFWSWSGREGEANAFREA